MENVIEEKNDMVLNRIEPIACKHKKVISKEFCKQSTQNTLIMIHEVRILFRITAVKILMLKRFKSKTGFSLLKNEETSDNEVPSFDILIPEAIYQYFPKYTHGPLREEFDTILKELFPYYRECIMKNGLSTFLVNVHPYGDFDLLSQNKKLVEEKVKILKGTYNFNDFLSKYGFPDEIGQLCTLKVAHINFLVQRHRISSLSLPLKEPFHDGYFIRMLKLRYPKIQSLFKIIPKFSFNNLIILSQEVEKWKLDQSWKEFDLYWTTYDLDSYFNPWTYARSYMIVQNNIYTPELKVYYSLFLLRLDFSTLISGSYQGVDGVFYFLQLFDLHISQKMIDLWMFEFLGYYNRPEVYQFCRINGIKKEFIGILIKDTISFENSKIKRTDF